MAQFFRANSRLAGSLTILIAIACLILLAGSLDGLELQAGQPFPGSQQAGAAAAEPTDRPGSPVPAVAPILSGLAALILLGLMVYVPAVLLRMVNLRRLAVPLLGLAAVLMLAVGLQWLEPSGQTPAPVGPGQVEQPPSFEYPVTPLSSPPPIFEYLVIAGVTLLGAAVVYAAFRSRHNAPSGDDPILEQAAQAVEALDRGIAWQSVIIRCYAEMSRRLFQEQGLQRSAPMTAREFHELLASRGVPSEPVAELTTLFEKARYGSENAGDLDEQRARGSLEQIIQYFQEAKA